MSDTTITRRSAIRTGGLAALAAGLLGSAGTPTVDAAPVPGIDRAEALLAELLAILPALTERDRSNLGHVLELLGAAAGKREDLLRDELAEAGAYIGPGNRVHDRMDRADEAKRRAADTHPAVVARYAAVYRGGGTDAGAAIRRELAGVYGDDLGDAIDGAAFDRHLHELYHVDRGWCDCAGAA